MELGSGTAEAEAPTAGRRGRVVMLVCNGVTGDSRVQKTARSAAAAGWDVVLLGRSPDGRPATWRIGGAQVRLLPVPTPLADPPRRTRRPFLALRPGTAAYRLQRAKARRDELRTRRAALLAGHPRGGPAAPPRDRVRDRARLALPRAAARFAVHWAGLRKRHLDHALRRRTAGTLADRVAVALWQRLLGVRCWRRLWPGLYDFELAYGRVVDALAPDLIHAHDFRMLGVGARAKIRAAAEGRTVRLVWDAHEYLPGVRPWENDPRWLPAHLAPSGSTCRTRTPPSPSPTPSPPCCAAPTAWPPTRPSSSTRPRHTPPDPGRASRDRDCAPAAASTRPPRSSSTAAPPHRSAD
ncbi:hypothetical protein ACWV95_15185 [Streptomyces albus]